jgi:glycosyltransferase involved in cell wall biosynthesis
MNKLKTIIIFYPNAERGGVINNLINITNYLSSYFDVYLITDSKKKFKFNRNVRFVLFHSINKIFNIYYKFFSTLKASFVLFSFLKKHDPENTIVFSAQSHIVAILISKILNFKIIIRNSEDIIASTIYSKNYLKSFFVFVLKIFFYNFATKIITNSKKSFVSLKKIIFFKKKLVLIYNPYLTKIYKNNKNRKKKNIILNVGRFCKQKNQIQLISAFERFQNLYSDFKLFLVGGGYNEKVIKQFIKNKNLQKKIYVKKWSKNLSQYYLSSKFFVLSSLYEGLPNSLLDSVNYELPVVSTVVAGAEDILMKNRGGYLAKVNNEDSLLLAMIECQKKYDISQNKILYAKMFLKRFLINKQNNKYLNLIKSA